MSIELKAINPAGRVETLDLAVATVDEAIRRAESDGYRVLIARDVVAGRGRRPGMRSRFPLLAFSRELHSLLDAGLALTEALEALVEKEQRPAVRAVIQKLIDDLRDGRSLSQSLERQPEAFPALYSATIRASEQTGDLPEALARFVSYQTQADTMFRTVVSASIYPMLLIGVGTLVALFLLVYLVPKFSTIYGELGHQLPWASRMLLSWGTFVGDNYLLVGLAALAAAAGVIAVVASPVARSAAARPLWKIAAIRDRLRVFYLARFYRTVGMLLKSGIPALTALDMAAGTLPITLSRGVVSARAMVRDGQPLSLAMDRHGLTTPIAVRMLRVGERSGQMAEMFERTGRLYEEDIAQWLDWFIKLLEPLLMIVIGALIGIVVLLMYMPIFELAGSVQ